MLLDRPIKLCHGAGDGVDRACLMTASNMIMGRGEHGDDNDCVCPVIRAFIVSTNDAMPLDLLAELYSPLIWEIPGTRTDDLSVMIARADLLAGVAQELAGSSAESAAGSAALLAALSAAEYAAEYAAGSAAGSARYAARYAESAAAQRKIWVACRDAILACCKIGDKRPIEAVMTPQQLCKVLG